MLVVVIWKQESAKSEMEPLAGTCSEVGSIRGANANGWDWCIAVEESCDCAVQPVSSGQYTKGAGEAVDGGSLKRRWVSYRIVSCRIRFRAVGKNELVVLLFCRVVCCDLSTNGDKRRWRNQPQ